MSRLPTIAPQDRDATQKAAAESFAAARGTAPFGPFAPMLHSPEAMLAAARMGEYLRYRSALPPRFSEFVILLVARAWSQDFEWAIHQPIALKEGVSPATAAAIADGRRPAAMTPEEDALHDFVGELMTGRRVSDMTFARVEALFGKRGCVDLTALVGYYSLLAMQMNVAETPAPEGAPTLKRFP